MRGPIEAAIGKIAGLRPYEGLGIDAERRHRSGDRQDRWLAQRGISALENARPH